MSGILHYDSNNSGGSFWLSPENWQDLVAAGWEITGRFGTEPYKAEKRFETAEEGLAEWRLITDEDPDAEGCNCCGNPHSFWFVTDEGETQYREIIVKTSGQWS